MINGVNLRRWYQDEAKNGPAGTVAFVNKFRTMLGLQDAKGKLHRNGDLMSNPVLESATIKPSEVSIRELAYAFHGESYREIYQPGGRFIRALEGNADIGLLPGYSEAMEAGENVPSQFANVSGFNSAALGLLEAKLLEAWNRPGYVSDLIMETVPHDLRSMKFIGISQVGDVAEARDPGNVHKRMQFLERFVTTPDTVNRGIAVDITREAIMFDRTSQLLQHAEAIGDALRLRKEYLCADCFLGVTNTYTYDNVNYNTYLTSGNWVNKFTGGTANPLNDWTALNVAFKAASRMTDQETGQPVMVNLQDVMVAPGALANAKKIIDSNTVETLTAGGTTRTFGDNPAKGFGLRTPFASIYFWNRIMAANGLNLGESAADGLWWIGDFKGAFIYVQNLALTTQRATPDSYTMADRGLVASLFADEMGVPGVREPRKVQQHFSS